MTREQLLALVDRVGSLDLEARRCAKAGCWTAALILMGACAEAMLLAAVCVFEQELRNSENWSIKENSPTRWPLGELVRVAKAAGWLPTTESPDADLFSSLSGDVGDAVAFLNKVRQMAAHPGAWLRVAEEERPDFLSEEHMRPTFAIFDGIASAIRDRTYSLLDDPIGENE